MAGVAVIEPEGRINEVNIEGLVSFGGVFSIPKVLDVFVVVVVVVVVAGISHHIWISKRCSKKH